MSDRTKEYQAEYRAQVKYEESRLPKWNEEPERKKKTYQLIDRLGAALNGDDDD